MGKSLRIFKTCLPVQIIMGALKIIEKRFPLCYDKRDGADENKMADRLTKEQRHKNMQNIKSKDTAIEVKLRQALWNKGYRYRKNYKTLPGKPDIALTKYKIAIFCDSEFFHGKDWEVLKPQLERGNNADFWVKKISDNKKRDDETDRQLAFLGWTVIRFWGKDILKNTDECVRVIEEAIFEQKMDSYDEQE